LVIKIRGNVEHCYRLVSAELETRIWLASSLLKRCRRDLLAIKLAVIWNEASLAGIDMELHLDRSQVLFGWLCPIFWIVAYLWCNSKIFSSGQVL